MPNVLSPRDLVFRPDNMDETVPHEETFYFCVSCIFSKIYQRGFGILQDITKPCVRLV